MYKLNIRCTKEFAIENCSGGACDRIGTVFRDLRFQCKYHQASTGMTINYPADNYEQGTFDFGRTSLLGWRLLMELKDARNL